MSEKRKNGTHPKKLAFSGMAIALAFVASYIRLFHMPTGGSVTFFSMLFITLIGWFYGPANGFLVSVAYAFLQFIQNPEILSIPQVLFDYFFAFGALGLSGFLSDRKHGLVTGYLLAVFGRFIFASLASLLFWSAYLPEGFVSPVVASAVYNGAYIGAEALLTVVVILLPPVSKALRKLKKTANDQA